MLIFPNVIRLMDKRVSRLGVRAGLVPSIMDSKAIEGIYSEITLEEKVSLYEEIYKPGIIDDMYAMGFLPMIADYSLLPHVAHLLLDLYKDKPLHPSDMEKYYQYPENYTATHYMDYPDQPTIQRLMFTGRILEYLNKSREKFSIGFDYDFVKRYLYHYRIDRAFALRDYSNEEDVKLTEVRIHEKEGHIVLPTLRENCARNEQIYLTTLPLCRFTNFNTKN
jgi:hypothetical protein